MIVGLATATMVASTRIMKKPIIIDQSARHGRTSAVAFICHLVRPLRLLDTSSPLRRYVMELAEQRSGGVYESAAAAAGTSLGWCQTVASKAISAITTPLVMTIARATSSLPSTPTSGDT